MGNMWGRLGLGFAGSLIAGPLGFIAGSFLGSMIFPTEFESEMPPVHDYPVQGTAVGTPIPIVLGTRKLAGNVIWAGKLQSYCIEHKAEGGKGGGNEQVSYERKYKRSFLIAICEGPATVLRMWRGKKLMYADSTFDFSEYGDEYTGSGILATQIQGLLDKLVPPVTFFDGVDNSGIGTLIGKSYSEYSNMCLAYFEDWELGNVGSLPNFVFEVSTGVSEIQDNHNITGETGQAAIYGNQWHAQTFTATGSYVINKVKLKMTHSPWYNPGIITASIRNVDGIHKPTGPDLCVGTTDGDTLPVWDEPGEWREISLSPGYTTTNGTEYAIVLRCVNPYTYWRATTNSAYAGGVSMGSMNAGVTWGASSATADYMFEIYQETLGLDMNFASIIKDLLINEKCGGYDESDLITQDFASIIAYCGDNNLKGSLVMTNQKPLPDWIAYICSHFQGYFYEIGGKVGLNCYRDQASVLSIAQDDLIRDGDEPPVHITKRPYETTFNRLEATWTDKSNDYKTAVVPAFDKIDQRESGQVRTKVIDLKMITDNELASKMAWRIFIDEFYRFSQYTFKLGYKSMLLEVGDVIDVTDGHLLTAQKMRVMSISEEKDGRKAVISAVEDISDLYPALTYSIQQSEEFGDEGIVLTDGTIAFRESWNNNKLYMSTIPGGEDCNGFYIYMSYDDASYILVGRSVIPGVTGGDANSTGTIQSRLAAHTAVIHRAGEWFDVSIGTLTDLDTAISDDDFFNNRKLAKIGDEIIAYKTCVESAVEGTWRVSNLIRGLFGTEPVAHVSGETFSTLDINFVYNFKESDIGKTLYFKIVSFYADEVQALSQVSSQSHVVSGTYRKPLPVSLMRINGREGRSTYKTTDVTVDWYFCGKAAGFGIGGYGNALWGSYTKDPLLERLKVELEEEDGTPITDSNYELDAYGEPAQLEILEADRNSKNPIVVKLSPMSNLLSDSRQITIEKI